MADVPHRTLRSVAEEHVQGEPTYDWAQGVPKQFSQKPAMPVPALGGPADLPAVETPFVLTGGK